MEKKKKTKSTIVLISIATVLLALICWYSYQWLTKRQEYPCNLKIFPPTVWILSAAFVCALIAGAVVLLQKDVRRWLVFFVVPLVFVVISLLGFAGFMYVVTQTASDGGEIRQLDDYSGWLRRRVGNVERWEEIISRCLEHTNVCSELSQKYRIPQDFFNALSDFTPLQKGCCMPPKECGYQYVNPTYWFNPNNTEACPDCLSWTNNQTELCYTCSSCQAGFLANLTQEWSKLILIFIVISVLLVAICVCLCLYMKMTQDHSDKGNGHN